MKILCPYCGKSVLVNGLGRKPLNIPLKNVCDALRGYSSVREAANKLGCSQGYIYKVLKDSGLKLQDIFNKETDKDLSGIKRQNNIK